MAATAVAARYPSLDMGIGVLSVRQRSIAAMAQDILTLQLLSTGTLAVGIGVGSSTVGDLTGPPGLTQLRQAITALRRLSAGEGHPGVGAPIPCFHFSVRPLPVLVGAIGPKAAAVAGGWADGLVLSLGTTPAAAQQIISEALSARRRQDPGSFEVVAYVGFGGLAGREGGTDCAGFTLHALGTIASDHLMERLLVGTGVDSEGVQSAIASGIAPIDLVEMMSVGGSLESCLDRFRAYENAGVTELALGLGPWTHDVVDALEAVIQLESTWSSQARV